MLDSAIRASARYAMNLGYKVHGVICGFDGLMTGDIKEIDFMEVEGYVCAFGPDATH